MAGFKFKDVVSRVIEMVTLPRPLPGIPQPQCQPEALTPDAKPEVTHQLSNHVLDFRCPAGVESKVRINTYTPQGDDNQISVLDFTKAAFIWDAGFNRSIYESWNYCPVRPA